jgi:hypothetical protein
MMQLEDGNLYSLFYYCDIAVNCQMEELNHLMRSNPDNLDRRYLLSSHNLYRGVDVVLHDALHGS